MLVILSVRVTLVKKSQRANAAILMLVTVSGVVNVACVFPQGYCLRVVLSLLYSTPSKLLKLGLSGSTVITVIPEP